MKRFSFGTLFVDEGNQEAFTICQDVAELRPVEKSPIVLVGDKGSGKTHLLYAIVNRVLAASGRTGLAYVTAHDFPDQVRGLIDDPSPVQRAATAILLVDQLEKFVDLVEELEAVVRIFLDHNHTVVLATNMHPTRLQNITAGLRSILESALLVEVAPRTPATTQVEMIKQEALKEAEAQLADQRKEIDRLQALVGQAQAQTPTPSQGTDQPEPDSAAARAAVVALKAENESLREELAAAKRRGDQARSEANELLRRAEELLGQIESNRAAFAAREAEDKQRITELETMLEGGGPASSGAVDELEAQVESLQADLAQAREETGQTRRSLEQRLNDSTARLRAELEDSRSQVEDARAALQRITQERDRIRLALDEASVARSQLQADLKGSERLIRDRDQELDALRHEAAAQVAEAHAQAGEIEGRLMRLQSALDRSCDTGRSTSYELESLGQQLAEAAGALSGLAGQLSVLDKLDEELDLDAAAEPAPDPHALVGEPLPAAGLEEYPTTPADSNEDLLQTPFTASADAPEQPGIDRAPHGAGHEAQVELPNLDSGRLFEFGTPEDLDEPTP